MGTITTSLTITFSDPSQASDDNLFLAAEIDDRKDGFNKGNTSFIIGDSPVFLEYKTPGLLVRRVTTSGSLAQVGGSVLVPQKETVVFANVNTANLSKVPAGGVTWKHLGGDTAGLSTNGTLVTTTRPIIAVYEASYIASADAFAVRGVNAIAGVPDLTVLIYLEGQN